MAKYAKAIVAALTAGLTAAGTALTDGVIDGAEWIAIAIAALAGLSAVGLVPNKQDPTRQPLDQG